MAAAGVWFRKGLRLHDNAALAKAVAEGGQVVPFFILDPSFDKTQVGPNRWQFLLESLSDLDAQLKKHASRLLVLRGKPEEVIQKMCKGTGGVPFKLTSLFWEMDTEPYAKVRDARIAALCGELGVKSVSLPGHTLLDLEKVCGTEGFKAPIASASIQKLVASHGPVPQPIPAPKKLPPLKVKGFDVPKLAEITKEQATSSGFPGGEQEALKRLELVCKDASYVCKFEKPKTASTGRPGKPWEPSTTGLSPYFKFGCISVRTAWHAFAKCQAGRPHSEPPGSLHGQLLFREMFHVMGHSVPNFDKDQGNSMCKSIPWGKDASLIAAWEEGRTGYPFIDALMRQLKQTGFMHHLGRHACACFLTRGDLWQHWTAGRDVFDRLLLDADWALNNGNWLWLAGVAPFSAPYFRVYDPCPTDKSCLNAEQTGDFIKHFVPELKSMPAKFIYKPWTAPLDVQKKAGCVIGKDYPSPVVDHAQARDANLKKFKAALDVIRSGKAPPPEKQAPSSSRKPAGASVTGQLMKGNASKRLASPSLTTKKPASKRQKS